ncbi:MAG: ribonuclease P protein component [Lachnospiraceae bacterium]|nr:ribonuclease P protein component [Lachnospiraceae bacterium]
MKHPLSLKKTEEFQKVYHKGKSYANKQLVMYVLPNGSGINRLGISISKKIGNSVKRHHLARLIRENMRLSEEMLNHGFDIVVVARGGAKNADYHQIGSALADLAVLHHLSNQKETGL